MAAERRRAYLRMRLHKRASNGGTSRRFGDLSHKRVRARDVPKVTEVQGSGTYFFDVCIKARVCRRRCMLCAYTRILALCTCMLAKIPLWRYAYSPRGQSRRRCGCLCLCAVLCLLAHCLRSRARGHIPQLRPRPDPERYQAQELSLRGALRGLCLLGKRPASYLAALVHAGTRVLR